MVIVYFGPLWEGGTCRMRMEALQRLGHTLVGVDSSYSPTGPKGFVVRAVRRATGWTIDPIGANEALIEAVWRHKPELVWVDKGLTLSARTLARIKELPQVRLVHYSPDDMSGKHNQSPQYLAGIPHYDLHVTTKSYNVPELHEMGARAVLFLNNAYCPRTHHPLPLGQSDRSRLGGPVGFIGAFEDERAEAMLYLGENGVPVRIWGGDWSANWRSSWRRWAQQHGHPNLQVETRALWGQEYAEAICSFDIDLCFLRKLNRDLQTQRSVEIPACGGFLLAERSPEHQKLFVEGVEAEFFGSREELLEKCRHYLAHPDERLGIAAAGHERCAEYSYDNHVGAVLRRLAALEENRNAFPATA